MAGTPAISDLVTLPHGIRGAAAAAVCAVAIAGLAAYDPAWAAVLALFGAGAALATVHPGLAAPYLALALPFGYWHPELAGVQAPALEAAAAGAAVGCLPRVVRLGARGFRPGAADAAFALFLAGVLISGAGPARKGAWAHDVLFWGALTIVFCTSSRAMRGEAWRRLFLCGIAVSGVVEAIVTIVQYVQGSSGRFSRLGGAIVYPQPEGTLQNPNAAAPFLVLCMFLLVGWALTERRGRRAVAATAVIVVGLSSLLPYSRGGWIALALGLLAWSGVQRRARYLIGTIGVLGGLLVAALVVGGTFGSRLTSLASHHFSDLYGFRLTLAGRAVHLIVRHPITGAGVFHEVGTYVGRPSLATHPHDLVLGVAVFFGVPAALGFVGVIVLAVRGSLRAALGGSGVVRMQGVGAFAALVALIVDGFLEYQFWNQASAVLTVLVLAYALALGESTSKRTVDARRDTDASAAVPTMTAMPPEVS